MATWKPGQVITDASLNTRDMVGKVVFATTRASTQTITTATQTAVIFDAPTIDTLGAYSAGTPTRFTPTVAGTYVFDGQISYAGNATGSRLGSWYKNGAQNNYIRHVGSAVEMGASMPGTPIVMNGTTDYVELYTYQDSGGNLATVASTGAPRMTVTYAGA